MTLRYLSLAGLLLLTLAGCEQGREAPPKTTVRAVNVAPSYAELGFRREEREQLAPLAFKGAVERSYDEDLYDFNVYGANPATGAADRVHTFAKEVVAGTLYTFVLLESAGQLQEVILEAPTPEAAATTAQIAVLHAGEALPAMDVYIEPPGTTIAAAVPRGGVAFLGQIAPSALPAGEYEVTLTEAGNPANVLLASSAFTLAAATSTALVIAPDAGEGTAALSALFVQADSTVLYDKSATSGLRVLNGATDTLARDVALNGQFGPPLFAAVPFATLTDYAITAPGADQPLQVTPAGNSGVLELDQKITMGASRLYTVLFAGDAGVLTHIAATDDRRRLAAFAKVQFFNAARQFTGIDFLLMSPGADPSTVAPRASLAAPAASTAGVELPGTYDLVLRQTGTATILAGPMSVTLAAGGIYSALAVNGPDTATAGVVLLDDFP